MAATKEANKPVSDKIRSSIALIDHSGTSLKYDLSQQTAQQMQQNQTMGPQASLAVKTIFGGNDAGYGI